MRTLLRSLILVAAVASPVTAQRPGQVVLHGSVVDADSHAPIVGAFVAGAEDRTGVLTDSLGRFSLLLERAGTYPLRFVQLGYHTLQATMPKQAETRMFTVGLKADAIEIEGLTVLADKLDQHDLFDTSAGTAAELLRQAMPFGTWGATCAPRPIERSGGFPPA